MKLYLYLKICSELSTMIVSLYKARLWPKNKGSEKTIQGLASVYLTWNPPGRKGTDLLSLGGP